MLAQCKQRDPMPRDLYLQLLSGGHRHTLASKGLHQQVVCKTRCNRTKSTAAPAVLAPLACPLKPVPPHPGPPIVFELLLAKAATAKQRP